MENQRVGLCDEKREMTNSTDNTRSGQSADEVNERAARLAQSLVRGPVQALMAYHVAPATGLIKLDAMENPYGWPAPMLDEWTQLLRELPINRYPDAGAHELKAALRDALRVPDGMDILLGNGSDEIIQLLILCLCGPGRCVLAPEPTFVMYRLLCNAMGGNYESVALHGDSFALDMPAMLAAIDAQQPELIFLAYPNNPTGNLFADEDVEALIAAAPGLVVLDEAYEPFARRSWMDRLAEFPNLVVMRTLSKLGLAGLRLGLLIGAPAWLEQLDKLRLPYNINSVSQASAIFALSHYDVFAAQAAQICSDRERLLQSLARFETLQVWRSEANFVFCRLREGDARALGAALTERGVLIRVLDGGGPALANCLRISVGTPAENSALLDALEASL
jgi:histidinol-phosphate aminotransferase